MFGRSHRFHGHNSLAPIYRRGSTLRGAQISLKYSQRPGRPYRVAVVVSRKVNKSAVVRNRIRRRIYEAVRVSNAVPAGYDLIFTVFHDQVADWPAAKLTEQVSELVKKIDSQSA